jgi:hypothetical protein
MRALSVLHRRFGHSATQWCVLAAVAFSLPGCSYFETMTSRRAQVPDDRTVLGRADNLVAVQSRDVANYVCERNLVLQCERGAAASFSCHCLRP